MGSFGIVAVIVELLALAASVGIWRKLMAPAAEPVATAARVEAALPFASAPALADVKIEGMVTLHSTAVAGPISSAEAAVVELVVKEDKGGEDSFAEILKLREAVSFVVDGAEIVLGDGCAIEGWHDKASSGPVVDASPPVHAFVQKHRQTLASRDGFTRRREFVERSVSAGEGVVVLGTKRAARVEASPDPSGYRDGGLTTSMVLVADRIFVAPDSQSIVAKGRRQPFGGGDIVAIGITFLVFGGIAAAILAGIYGAIYD